MKIGHMRMGEIAGGRATAIVLATFAAMLAAARATSALVASIRFTHPP